MTAIFKRSLQRLLERHTQQQLLRRNSSTNTSTNTTTKTKPFPIRFYYFIIHFMINCYLSVYKINNPYFKKKKIELVTPPNPSLTPMNAFLKTYSCFDFRTREGFDIISSQYKFDDEFMYMLWVYKLFFIDKITYQHNYDNNPANNAKIDIQVQETYSQLIDNLLELTKIFKNLPQRFKSSIVSFEDDYETLETDIFDTPDMYSRIFTGEGANSIDTRFLDDLSNPENVNTLVTILHAYNYDPTTQAEGMDTILGRCSNQDELLGSLGLDENTRFLYFVVIRVALHLRDKQYRGILDQISEQSIFIDVLRLSPDYKNNFGKRLYIMKYIYHILVKDHGFLKKKFDQFLEDITNSGPIFP